MTRPMMPPPVTTRSPRLTPANISALGLILALLRTNQQEIETTKIRNQRKQLHEKLSHHPHPAPCLGYEHLPPSIAFRPLPLSALGRQKAPSQKRADYSDSHPRFATQCGDDISLALFRRRHPMDQDLTAFFHALSKPSTGLPPPRPAPTSRRPKPMSGARCRPPPRNGRQK